MIPSLFWSRTRANDGQVVLQSTPKLLKMRQTLLKSCFVAPKKPCFQPVKSCSTLVIKGLNESEKSWGSSVESSSSASSSFSSLRESSFGPAWVSILGWSLYKMSQTLRWYPWEKQIWCSISMSLPIFFSQKMILDRFSPDFIQDLWVHYLKAGWKFQDWQNGALHVFKYFTKHKNASFCGILSP